MSVDTERREGPATGGSIVRWLVGILVVVGLVIAAIFIWAAIDDEDASAVAAGVTVSDITDDPEQYYGSNATVFGEVNEVIGPGAFTIGGEDFIGGGELLVVSANDFALPEGIRDEDRGIREGDIVQVTGTVRESADEYIQEELEEDVDEGLFEDFEDGPALYANDIRLSPRLSELPAGAITVEGIAEHEDLYDGEQVNLNGEVAELVSSQSFFLSDVSEDNSFDVSERILVVAAADAVPETLAEDVPVDVTGTVRIINEDNEEGAIEEAFGFDIEDGLFDGLEDEPVLIAKSITTGATKGTIALESILTDPMAYLDSTVKTGGTVEETIHPQAFILGLEDGDAPVDAEVLVVGKNPLKENVVDSAFVQVVGTPYLFDADFEDEFSEDFPFLWEDDAFDELEDSDLVIVAQSIDVVR